MNGMHTSSIKFRSGQQVDLDCVQCMGKRKSLGKISRQKIVSSGKSFYR